MKSVKAFAKNFIGVLPMAVQDFVLPIRYYAKKYGYVPNVFRPKTYNEKILHRILFDRRHVLTEIADKAAVRSYVTSRVGAKILPQLYFITTRPETIPFDELPNQFVVKPTHGSGWIKIIRDKSRLDRATLIEICNRWLNESFYKVTHEWAYRDIEPKIIVEQFIDEGTGEAPLDYKFFVFDGVVELVQVNVDRFKEHRVGHYSPRWDKIYIRSDYDDTERDIPRPPHLAEMVTAAETLGKDWDFIRVDLYDTPDQFYFGELTSTPGSALVGFRPPEFDEYLGRRWKLRPVLNLPRIRRS
jgi:TupA-like ATPgrasp